MSKFSLLCCVVNMGDAQATIKHARKYGVKGGIVSLGRGTVHSHLLQALGLNEVRKEIVKMIVEEDGASAALQGISRDMHFEKPHHGIAFSMPVRTFVGGASQSAQQPKTDEVKGQMYNIIYVIVNKGDADDVIEAANAAGARGATIVNARGIDVREAPTFFNLQVVPEKEEVFIIAKTELKDAIVDSIRSRVKTDEPGSGGLLYV
ncbi:MAG: P-II family nitrogen regulator, partial [Eubacteriales bacterium]|nr:P-II family nitrogen regulator [Eubacteriales bacterium]